MNVPGPEKIKLLLEKFFNNPEYKLDFAVNVAETNDDGTVFAGRNLRDNGQEVIVLRFKKEKSNG